MACRFTWIGFGIGFIGHLRLRRCVSALRSCVDGMSIVAVSNQPVFDFDGKIFVNFELHAACNSAVRSRVNSAAYATAACTSSADNEGFEERIS